MIDSELIEAIRSGEQAAFKQMYEQCIRYVYAIVKRYVSNDSDHQDLIQEIFARVFVKIDTYDYSKGDFKYWLRRLAINECLMHYRKNNSGGKIIPLKSVAHYEAEEKIQLNGMSKAEVAAFLQRMPEGYKQIFMMVVIDDYTHQEAARMLDISPETSRSQLSRAKKWLKDNLSNNNLKFLASGF
mgnify:FL=1